ncbi:MAG: enoyl-CoA hydratase/isomerase family protein [Pseudomonadota bacterium]
MSTEEIIYQRDNGIGTITLNRPQARNALTFEMYDRLAEIATGLQQPQSDVSALIITGAGVKAFAAGTDISRFRDFKTEQHALDYENRMDRVLGSIEAIPIPVIAAINGACTGGGAAIAACCDLRIATSTMRFGFPIARTLGNCLSAGNLSRLCHLIGGAKTKELLFTSGLINAEESLRLGLISEIVDDVQTRALELAEQMQQMAPLTLAATKEALRRIREHSASVDDDDLIISCYTSNDFHEGLEAFLAKRKPNWTGT